MSLVVRSERVVLPDGVRPATIHRPRRAHRLDRRLQRPARRRPGAGRRRRTSCCPGSSIRTSTSTIPGAPTGKASRTRRARRRPAASRRSWTCRSTAFRRRRPWPASRQKRAAARGRCHVDVGFWGGVVPGNAAELAPLARAGVLGFKCFLCPSGVDEFAHVGEARSSRGAADAVAALGLPLLAHAELPALLRDASRPADGARPIRGATRPGSRAVRTRASRPPSSCSSRLAREFGARVHIVHLASAEALPAIRAARAAGVSVTVETCPHYLTFAAEEIADGATAFKCAPPIRSRANRERLWQALVDGDIDLVATDHSPAPPALKHLDDGDFVRAWGGIASLQLGLRPSGPAPPSAVFHSSALADWLAAAPGAAGRARCGEGAHRRRTRRRSRRLGSGCETDGRCDDACTIGTR